LFAAQIVAEAKVIYDTMVTEYKRTSLNTSYGLSARRNKSRVQDI